MKHPLGLSHTKAIDALKHYGENIIVDKHRVTWVTILLRQFTENKVIYLLAAAMLISLMVAKFVTGGTIGVVIVLVIVVGFIQEYKAEAAVESLRHLTRSSSTVYRDGQMHQIESRFLVPDDIVLIRAGDVIPADGIIISGNSLHINESALTGESFEVSKYPMGSAASPISDDNRVFMGTSVLQGKAHVQITHTGMNTKLGGIADMITATEKKILLTEKVNSIINVMIIIATVIGLASALLLLIQSGKLTQDVALNALILFIALAVSAFPEDLPMVMIATLTTGARRMADKNAIVNRMGIIETLGEVTVICSDKTGTLTKGIMSVKHVTCDQHTYTLTDQGFSLDLTQIHKSHLSPHHPLMLFLKTACICNEAQITYDKKTHEFALQGSATESALLLAGRSLDIHREDFAYDIVDEHPFDSIRKLMSVIVNEQGHHIMYIKGAPELLIERCTHHLTLHGLQAFARHAKKEILEKNKKAGAQGMRTIACAYKVVANEKDTDEENLTFLGFAAIEDQPRPEVKDSIAQCISAGIQVKMITGDQPATAQAIGSSIGLVGPSMTGPEIELLTDEELRVKVNETILFARVQPQHKYRIMKALKDNGEIVAMTGDGVNDAPALKEAHVGIAMGKNGTEVTRSVADITLRDDNFATIVLAIREGRVIFKNIRKFIGFEISSNIAELLVNFLALAIGAALGWSLPLITSIQILYMNLITDNIPAMALGQSEADPFIMHEKPRRKDANPILSKSMYWLIATLAGLMTTFILVCHYLSTTLLLLDPVTARTTTMVSFIFLQMVNAFEFRSFRKGVLTESIFRNPYLIYATLISVTLTLAVVYTPLNRYFDTGPIGTSSWWLILTSMGMYLIAVDTIKYLYNILTKRTSLAQLA